MQQVAKVASPIIVLLGLLIFTESHSKYAIPTLFFLISISTLFLICKPLQANPKASGILLFWLAPLALLWLLSERSEGREVNSISITVELLIAGVATVLLVTREGLRKSDWSLFLAIFLTWAVAYLSGSTGGADRMHPLFDFLGLSVNQLNDLIVVVRKTIHVSFYGSLAWLFSRNLKENNADRKTILQFAFLFPFCVSIADEYRQSMMPNRGGSFSDVILDMSATLLVLFFVARTRTHKQV